MARPRRDAIVPNESRHSGPIGEVGAIATRRGTLPIPLLQAGLVADRPATPATARGGVDESAFPAPAARIAHGDLVLDSRSLRYHAGQ